jgi:YihY family inner membrane protein
LANVRDIWAGLRDRLDAWQQRRRGISFLVAVYVRYRDDRGRQFGALLSYYGFVSLFPLLLVLVTVLGVVLDDNDDLRRRILDTVYARIPVVGEQLRESTKSLQTSGVALVLGLLVSLWAGLAVVKHAQDALNLQWGVPWARRPGFVQRNLRALGALAVVGSGIVLATVATNVVAFLPDLTDVGRVLGAVFAILVNIAVLTASYRVLIISNIAWRKLLTGGIVGGFLLWVLQRIGGEYVAHVILDASDVYGAFAVMFGLLVWIALLSRVILLAGEVNVVRAKRLWPQTFVNLDPIDDPVRDPR